MNRLRHSTQESFLSVYQNNANPTGVALVLQNAYGLSLARKASAQFEATASAGIPPDESVK